MLVVLAGYGDLAKSICEVLVDNYVQGRVGCP